MNTIKVEKHNTKIIAHRGLSGIEVENTASAFVAAGNRSYYGIETDVYKTADGKYILGHDDNYKRLSGKEIYIEKETFESLSQVRFFDKDGSLDRSDLCPCSLESYIKICKKYEKKAILELKADFSKESIKEIIDIITELGYIDNTTFISFIYENLLKVREFLPNQSAQYLFWKITDSEIERLQRDKIDVDVWVRDLTKEQIDACHKAGLLVNCWTVDTCENADVLISWGIDYITSNILE